MTKILIVEDEPNMVAGLRDNFEYEGYEVITAPDGVAGLERAIKEKPDLVILDVMMPRMSGLDVCKQLKAKRASVPIITANSPAIRRANQTGTCRGGLAPSASASTGSHSRTGAGSSSTML